MIEKLENTIGSSFLGTVRFTHNRQTVSEKQHFPLPIGTKWFDAFFEFSQSDCDEQSDVDVQFFLQAYSDDDNISLPKISIYLGDYKRKELKDVLTRITNAL